MQIPTFEIFPLPRIVFGRGRIASLPSLIGPLGSTILLIHNGGDRPRAKIQALLQPTDIHLIPWRQKGEPTVSDIDELLEVARQAACTGVIGIGGGSAIDAAKAAAGLLANGGQATDYMEVIGLGKKFARPSLPWMAIPTTAGTGAEVTRNAVLGDPAKRFKASLRSEFLLPLAALIDPELAVEVPPAVTAASGMDAICQCIEAYTSNGANPVTDGLALRGVQLGSASIRQAFTQGDDLNAREGMASAALLSGIALTNAGLGAVHGFAAPLGANFPVPHGVVCAALLPHVMRANIAAARAGGNAELLRRYAEVGRALSASSMMADPEAIENGVAVADALRRDLGVPLLGQYGMTEADIAPMVALAKTASSMKFNPARLSDIELAGVLRAAVNG